MSLVSFSHRSVRSVRINIINYRGILSANLHNTMQIIQHGMKKTAHIFKQKQDFPGAIFYGGRIFSRKLIQNVGTVFNISLFLGVLFFLCVRNIRNRIQKYFKRIFILLKNQLWGVG